MVFLQIKTKIGHFSEQKMVPNGFSTNSNPNRALFKIEDGAQLFFSKFKPKSSTFQNRRWCPMVFLKIKTQIGHFSEQKIVSHFLFQSATYQHRIECPPYIFNAQFRYPCPYSSFFFKTKIRHFSEQKIVPHYFSKNVQFPYPCHYMQFLRSIHHKNEMKLSHYL